MKTYSPQGAILRGGLIAGTIDIGAAALINWLSPLIIMQAIASGILGRPSFYDGVSSMLLGLVLQWVMSLIIAAVFVSTAAYVPWLKQRWVAAGLAYGIVIYFVMNEVVVPLSNAWPRHAQAFNLQKSTGDMLAMLLFGLIVARFAQRVPKRSTR